MRSVSIEWLMTAVSLVLWGLAACGGTGDAQATKDAEAHVNLGADGGLAGEVNAGPTTDAAANTLDASESPVTSEPACEGSEDCDEGMICSCRGVCETPSSNACNSDVNCLASQWCDPCLGHCEEKRVLCGSCSLDGLCEDGACQAYGGCEGQGACLVFGDGQSYCGRACLSDAGCPSAYRCVEVPGYPNLQCVPQTGSCTDLGLCQSDGECPDGNVCKGQCADGGACTPNGCADGTACSDGQCGPGCSDDLGCPNGTVCVAARCVPPCADDSECVAPKACTDEGKCKEEGACEGSVDCPEPETYCDKSLGRCVSGCLVDADCKDASQVCDGGECRDQGCTGNYQCAFEQECDKNSGDCVPMKDPHCASCDAAAEGQCGGEPNLCLSFQSTNAETGEAEEKGDFCLLACAEGPTDRCPQGYQCETVTVSDAQGASAERELCARACWQSPVGSPTP